MGQEPTVRPMRIICLGLVVMAGNAIGQTNLEERLHDLQKSLNFVEGRLEKRINDLLWIHEMADVAKVEKVRFTGPPPARKSDAVAKTNAIIIYAYSFLPRQRPQGKLPLIILVHGDVHGDLKPQEDGRIVRELIE